MSRSLVTSLNSDEQTVPSIAMDWQYCLLLSVYADHVSDILSDDKFLRETVPCVRHALSRLLCILPQNLLQKLSEESVEEAGKLLNK